jgi:hypothetical protein
MINVFEESLHLCRLQVPSGASNNRQPPWWLLGPSTMWLQRLRHKAGATRSRVRRRRRRHFDAPGADQPMDTSFLPSHVSRALRVGAERVAGVGLPRRPRGARPGQGFTEGARFAALLHLFFPYLTTSDLLESYLS